MACCGPPTASPRAGPSVPWGVLAGTQWGAPMPRQDGIGSRAPTLFWLLECVLVKVFVSVLHAHLELRTLATLLDWKRCSSSQSSLTISFHSRLTRSDSLQSFGGLWVLSSMKSFARSPILPQFLIDMFFIPFDISSHVSCLLPAVSQSILFTQIQICFFLGRLIDQL